MTRLNGIINSAYVKLSSSNSYFSKHVAKSVFSYYCCVFAYARLLRLAQYSGNPLTAAKIAFVDFIDGSSFLVSEPLSLYLAAFGKTFLTSGANLRFRVASQTYTAAGIPGYFGHVSAETHVLYMAYPCLVVCAKRIQMDAANTEAGPTD
ncbi:hypothetical protein MTO96_042708 [Rhipicephalus appendiculatus]